MGEQQDPRGTGWGPSQHACWLGPERPGRAGSSGLWWGAQQSPAKHERPGPPHPGHPRQASAHHLHTLHEGRAWDWFPERLTAQAGSVPGVASSSAILPPCPSCCSEQGEGGKAQTGAAGSQPPHTSSASPQGPQPQACPPHTHAPARTCVLEASRISDTIYSRNADSCGHLSPLHRRRFSGLSSPARGCGPTLAPGYSGRAGPGFLGFFPL